MNTGSCISHFEANLARLPESVKQELEGSFRRWCERLDGSVLKEPVNRAFIESAITVCCSSLFVAESCVRDVKLWTDVVSGTALYTTIDGKNDYKQTLAAQTATNEKELMALLRVFRRRETVRIAWRDIAGWATVEETLSDLSALADACVQYALDFLHAEATAHWGLPVLSNGKEQRLVVLAMGKLGGGE
ncbi:MAG: bifunctional [glutamate--ammonia ligase]-adenylyl-L-tyrosine phosphorylase/[glutamate--ammonia-ligase] adenylyltransferase, partial [Methylococcales bacterium]